MKNPSLKIEQSWNRWVLNTARSYDDFYSIIDRTHFEAIDSDHRIWIEYCVAVNDLIEKMNSGIYDLDAINIEGNLFLKLYEYTQQHFSREEKIITQFNLQGLELQQSQHEKIIEALKNVLSEFSAGKITVSQKLKLAVLEWGVSHINTTDHQVFRLENFVPFFDSVKSFKDIAPIIQMTSQPQVDTQHQQVTQKAIELIQIIESEKADNRSKKIHEHFHAFKDVIQKHFEYEENFMRGNQIPTYIGHKAIHDSFLNNLSHYLINPSEFKYKILSWWINHINEVDGEAFKLEKWALPYLEQAASSIDLKWLIARMHIEELDKDHFEFIEFVDKLINEGSSIELLEKIHHYAEGHFYREERYMQDFNIPFHNHIIEHRNILKFISKLKHSLANQEPNMEQVSSIRAKILLYWINHINTTDHNSLVIYE